MNSSLPKDDKDFLKMKEEAINKINTYKNMSRVSRINE